MEAFFNSLKKERVRLKIYPTRKDGRSDVSDYIEIFYNRSRRYSHVDDVGPVAKDDPLYTPTLEVADDMPAHIEAAATATQFSLPFKAGQLMLGTCRHHSDGRQVYL